MLGFVLWCAMGSAGAQDVLPVRRVRFYETGVVENVCDGPCAEDDLF